MYICPKCAAFMEFIYQYGGGYWACKTCGYIPMVTYSNHT